MFLFQRTKNGRRRGWWPRVAQMEILDGRQMLSATVAPAIGGNVQLATSVGTQPDDWDPVAADRRSAPAVPAYSSLPGAATSLYLDFNGDYQLNWRNSSVNTPAFDLNGDRSSFNNAERSAIQQIYSQVAEDFAPFQLNVTTVKPGSFANGVGLRVVIGGNGNWFTTSTSTKGVALIGSFANDDPNVCFVFSSNFSVTEMKSVAEAVSHEAGHAFGLMHQSLYDGSSLVREYHTGLLGTGIAPIMGNSLNATRGLWWQGTSTSASTIQDDLSILSNNTNGFGYRTDDHGDTQAVASSFMVSGSQLSAAGIITKTSDVDVFKFDAASAGSITVNLVLPANNNLHGKIKLSDSSGRTLAEVDPPGVTQFNATLTAQVAAGTYFVTVASHGGYGDIGQYSLTGTFVVPVAADTNLVATSNSSTRVSLTWRDNATNETGHVVERSSNGGQSFTTVATLGANATSYTDNTVSGSTTYQYRVRAFNATATALNSNVASVTTLPIPTPPLAPSGATATVQSARSVRFTWADNSNNETSFVIQRQRNNGSWSDVATVGANTTSFTDNSLSARTTVRYRVRAVNSVGVSDWSLSASVTTPRA